jgi:hypothetical protein
MPTKTKHERFLYAEEQAARHLGNYNEEVERGAVKTAAKSLEKAQRWLDRANDLSGRGSE